MQPKFDAKTEAQFDRLREELGLPKSYAVLLVAALPAGNSAHAPTSCELMEQLTLHLQDGPFRMNIPATHRKYVIRMLKDAESQENIKAEKIGLLSKVTGDISVRLVHPIYGASLGACIASVTAGQVLFVAGLFAFFIGGGIQSCGIMMAYTMDSDRLACLSRAQCYRNNYEELMGHGS